MRAERSRGFTLVEMLIAIGILAMIAVLGWRALDGMLRSRAALTDSIQQTRAMQRTFAQLQDDCAHLALDEAIGSVARLQAGANRLSLIRNAFATDAPSGLQAVVYQVEDGVLRRRESAVTRDVPVLERFLRQPDAMAAVRDTPLQQGVTDMRLRIWTGDWHAEPAPTASARGLEVVLQLRDGDGSTRRLFLLAPA
jgi:general secretion pathway protein J